jgi:hypothetical protein
VIRLTLRQFRTGAIIGCAALAALALVITLTGPHLAEVNDAFQRACRAVGDCQTAPNPVFTEYPQLQVLLPVIGIITPALLGLFFGAPLIASELESGTYRLAWTQSVTRRRWLATKLAVVGLAAVALTGLLIWMLDWWAGPLDAVKQDRFSPGVFSWHGVAPIGYTLFAFALGVAAGVLARRTVPAMAITLVGFVAARLAVENWMRPNFAVPVHRSFSLLTTGFGSLQLSAPSGTYSLTAPPVVIRNAWVLSTALVDRANRALTGKEFIRICSGYAHLGGEPPTPAQIMSIHAACVRKLSLTYHTVASFQPGSRFWPFQWLEMGVFIVAALALGGLAYWGLRRRFT